MSVVDTEVTPKLKRCRNCNRTGHSSKEKFCLAWGKLCDNCGKEGHFKVCCKGAKKQSNANKVTGEVANSNVVKADVMRTKADCNLGVMAELMMTVANV